MGVGKAVGVVFPNTDRDARSQLKSPSSVSSLFASGGEEDNNNLQLVWICCPRAAEKSYSSLVLSP